MSMTTFVTATIGFGLVLCAPIAFVVSFVVLRLYRRRVTTDMQLAAQQAEARSVEAPRSRRSCTNTGASELAASALRGPTRGVIASAAAMACFAAAMTVGNLLSTDTGTRSPLSILVMFAGYVFPLVPMVALLRGTRSALLSAAGSYVVVFVLLGIGVSAVGSGFWTPFGFFLINALPTLAIGLMFLGGHRRVGPLVYGFVMLAFIGPNLAMFVIDHGFGINSTLTALGAILAIVAGLVVFAIAALALLALVKRLYLAKLVSDQGLSVDALLLPYAACYAGMLMFDDLAVALVTMLAALVSYRLVSEIAGRLLARGPTSDAPAVLFLRVFRTSGPRDLFDRWSSRWRYAGPVRLITGPDLASSLIEPHQFLDFVFGRLSSMFVEGAADLDRALEAEDRRPDPDGRYRITSYYCRANTWEEVFRRLAASSDAIVMDLRGFGQWAHGACTELQSLAEHDAVSHLVVLVDDSTDMNLVDGILGTRRAAVRFVGAPNDVKEILGAISSAACGSA
jgi:hypothetical protein